MKKLLFLLLLLPSLIQAQDRKVPFSMSAAPIPANQYAHTNNGLWIDSVVKFTKYKMIGDSVLLGVAADGKLYKITKEQVGLWGGGSGNTYSQTIAFTSSVPFTWPVTVMNTNVSGSLVFSANTTGAVAGYGATVRIKGNGTNTPTFSAPLRRVSTSDTFSSTTDMVHQLFFLYNGTDYIYSISQLYVNDVTAPTVSSMTATGEHTIVVVLNEVVTATNVGWSFSDGSPYTISGIAGSGTNTLTFTITESILFSDAITASYNSGTGNTIDASGNELVTFSGTSVTNSLPSPVGNLTFATRSNITSSFGIFTNTGGVFGGTGLDALNLDAGEEGRVYMKIITTTDESAMLGFDATNAEQPYTDFLAAVWSSSTNTLHAVVNGGLVTDISTGPALNTYVGIIRKSNGEIWIQKSNDAISWTDVYDTGVVNAGTLYIVCAVNVKMSYPNGDNLD